MKIIAASPKKFQNSGPSLFVKNLELTGLVRHVWLEDLSIDKDTELIIVFGHGLEPCINKYRKKLLIADVYCSPFGQAELTEEGFYHLRQRIHALDSGKLDYLIVLSKPIAKSLSKIHQHIVHVSPLFDINEPLPYTPLQKRYGFGLFGSFKLNKNIVNQFAGVSLLNLRIPIHVMGSKRSTINLLKKFFDFDVIIHKRLKRPNLLKLMSKMKLGLQVSWSESFNYSTLELALMNVPSIVGSCIYWYVKDPLLSKYCVAYEPDNPIEIAKKIKALYKDHKLYKKISIRVKKVALKEINQNLAKAKSTLKSMIRK